jgi:hypothetical protein
VARLCTRGLDSIHAYVPPFRCNRHSIIPQARQSRALGDYRTHKRAQTEPHHANASAGICKEKPRFRLEEDARRRTTQHRRRQWLLQTLQSVLDKLGQPAQQASVFRGWVRSEGLLLMNSDSEVRSRPSCIMERLHALDNPPAWICLNQYLQGLHHVFMHRGNLLPSSACSKVRTERGHAVGVVNSCVRHTPDK